jgi:hypothetical protein
MTRTIAHFGVRGMKWGVRKATTRGSTPPSKRKPKEEPAAEKRQSLDMHAMSDTELRNAINRIKLQREYAQLTAPPPKEKSRGRQVVENIVYGSAEAAGKKVLTGALTNVLNNVLPPALREAPKKSKTDEVAEKVLKGLKGDQKKGGGDDSGPEKSPGGDGGPKKPSGGGGKPPNQRGKTRFDTPDDNTLPEWPPRPRPKPSGSFPPPPMGGSGRGGGREGGGNPFRRRKKTSGSSQSPPVRVPDATVNPSSSGSTPVASLPRKPIATQGRPGHSGSGRSYDNDSSNSDRKGRGAEQGRPGSTGKRKKRRFGFGHEGLDGIVVDILGEID